MPQSIYIPGNDGNYANNQWFVSILARKGVNTNRNNGSSEGSPGGHTYIAFEWWGGVQYRHIVFHLVGGRGNSSPGQHNIAGRASVERLQPSPNNNRPYVSVGGLTGRAVSDWSVIQDDTPWDWNGTNDLACAGIAIPITEAETAIATCFAYSSGVRSPGNFSLIGANVRLGTNCVTFALQMLHVATIRENWTMYSWSFVSPYQAIRRGNLGR